MTQHHRHARALFNVVHTDAIDGGVAMYPFHARGPLDCVGPGKPAHSVIEIRPILMHKEA